MVFRRPDHKFSAFVNVTIPVNEFVDGVTIPTRGEAVQHCGRSRSGRRRTDLVLMRLLLEVGFCFMTGGLHDTDQ